MYLTMRLSIFAACLAASLLAQTSKDLGIFEGQTDVGNPELNVHGDGLTAHVYVGLVVGSHNAKVIETAVFSDVTVELLPKAATGKKK